jgi:hypothetical protein
VFGHLNFAVLETFKKITGVDGNVKLTNKFTILRFGLLILQLLKLYMDGNWSIHWNKALENFWMKQTMNELERRIIDISYKEKMGHLSFGFNAVNIIDEIYNIKNL